MTEEENLQIRSRWRQCVELDLTDVEKTSTCRQTPDSVREKKKHELS